MVDLAHMATRLHAVGQEWTLMPEQKHAALVPPTPEMLRQLVAKWRAMAVDIDTVHATMAVGYRCCADDLDAASRAAPVPSETDAIRAFVARVNARAEADMLNGRPVTGAHHRALEAEVRALPAAPIPPALDLGVAEQMAWAEKALQAELHTIRAALRALAQEMREQVAHMATGVSQEYWNPTLQRIAQWADRLAALLPREPTP